MPMVKKYKLKTSVKVIFIITFLSILIVVLIINYFKSKSYSLEYDLNDFAISENYDNNEKNYYYEITYNDVKYNFIISEKYHREKKLITNITAKSQEDYTCLIVESSIRDIDPLCSYQGDLIDYHLIPIDIDLDNTHYIEEYQAESNQYTIYNTDNSLLIWNYRGFDYLTSENINTINIFDKDIYDVPLITRVNEYVIIPDYEQSYTFNKIYILNLKTLKTTEWTIKYNISFDSYILGTNKDSIFIVDKKNKIEYELVPYKKKMRIVASGNKKGLIYVDGKSESITLTKLTTTNQTFTSQTNYNFSPLEDGLYLSYSYFKNKIKVSNQTNINIIYQNNDNLYYLINDTLYKYSLLYGEIKLITYSEWNFNSTNPIIIYD